MLVGEVLTLGKVASLVLSEVSISILKILAYRTCSAAVSVMLFVNGAA